MSKQGEKWTLNVLLRHSGVGFFCYIGLDSKALSWHYWYVKRMPYMYTYQNDTLFTVFTTDWKTTVRKIRKLKYYSRISSRKLMTFQPKHVSYWFWLIMIGNTNKIFQVRKIIISDLVKLFLIAAAKETCPEKISLFEAKTVGYSWGYWDHIAVE